MIRAVTVLYREYSSVTSTTTFDKMAEYPYLMSQHVVIHYEEQCLCYLTTSKGIMSDSGNGCINSFSSRCPSRNRTPCSVSISARAHQTPRLSSKSLPLPQTTTRHSNHSLVSKRVTSPIHTQNKCSSPVAVPRVLRSHPVGISAPSLSHSMFMKLQQTYPIVTDKSLTISGRVISTDGTLVTLTGQSCVEVTLDACVIIITSDNDVVLFRSANSNTTSRVRTTGCKFIITAPSVTLYEESSTPVTFESLFDEFVIESPSFIVGDVHNTRIIRPKIDGSGTVVSGVERLISPQLEGVTDNIIVGSLKDLVIGSLTTDVSITVPEGSHELKTKTSSSFDERSVFINGSEVPVATTKSGIEFIGNEDTDNYWVYSSSHEGFALSLPYRDVECSEYVDFNDNFTMCKLQSSIELTDYSLTCKLISLQCLTLINSNIQFVNAVVELTKVSLISSTLRTDRCLVSCNGLSIRKSKVMIEDGRRTSLGGILSSGGSAVTITDTKLTLHGSKFISSHLSVVGCRGLIDSITCRKSTTTISRCNDISVNKSVINFAPTDGLVIINRSLVDLRDTEGTDNSVAGVSVRSGSTLRVIGDSNTICGKKTDVLVGSTEVKWDGTEKFISGDELTTVIRA